MIDLASPCSHPDPAVRERRFRAACRATAALLRAGQVACSPVVHGHPLVACGLPADGAFGQRFGRQCLPRCDAAVVLTLDGGEGSAGVRAETRVARELGERVRFLGLEGARGSPPSAHVAPGVPR
jgi:hypothetical protein